MESPKPPMPDVSDSERSPLVDALLEMIAWQQKRIEELEQQILKLKGETTKPKIKPSTMDKETDNKGNKDENDDKGPKKGPKRKKQHNSPFIRRKSENRMSYPRGVRSKVIGMSWSRIW